MAAVPCKAHRICALSLGSVLSAASTNFGYKPSDIDPTSINLLIYGINIFSFISWEDSWKFKEI